MIWLQAINGTNNNFPAYSSQLKQLLSGIPLTMFPFVLVLQYVFLQRSCASYLLPAAAIGVMGYCYVRWKGWSFSDVMFVTKRNMANGVATVTKQLENVNETLASTRRHLTKKLEVLDLKVEEQNELTQLIANDVNEVKSNLSQIGGDFELIRQMISGLEGKLKLVESKQDITNSGLWYLCQLADGFKE
ncbi:uncharacterized protein LOC114715216 [Neltuma alba]|uniref:uncharacterized protein LOC114715216 n=1 Tax=Neltuma alba TaxID=207710 RepID=UPI0010A5597A|nr:uncharacterized protein LOC114715216 [Prosopis alba]